MRVVEVKKPAKRIWGTNTRGSICMAVLGSVTADPTRIAYAVPANDKEYMMAKN